MSAFLSKVLPFGAKSSGSKLPPFQLSISLEQRRKMSARMLEETPDRVPVILTRSVHAAPETPKIKKTKLLIPGNLTVGEVLTRIRQDWTEPNGLITSQQAIFLFVGKGTLPPIASTMQHLYSRFADEDGFLYITYSAESTFGQ